MEERWNCGGHAVGEGYRNRQQQRVFEKCVTGRRRNAFGDRHTLNFRSGGIRRRTMEERRYSCGHVSRGRYPSWCQLIQSTLVNKRQRACCYFRARTTAAAKNCGRAMARRLAPCWSETSTRHIWFFCFFAGHLDGSLYFAAGQRSSGQRNMEERWYNGWHYDRRRYIPGCERQWVPSSLRQSVLTLYFLCHE